MSKRLRIAEGHREVVSELGTKKCATESLVS